MAQSFNLASVRPSEIALSPDGLKLYSAGTDGILRVYSLKTGALIDSWQVGTKLGGLDISPDGSFLMVVERQPLAGGWQTGSTTITVYMVDTATGQATSYPYQANGLDYLFFDVAVLSDGKVLLSQDFAGSGWVALKLLDPATGQYTLGAQVRQSSVFSPSETGARVFIAEPNTSGGTVDIYQTGSGIVATGGGPGFNWGIQAYTGSGSMAANYIYNEGILIYNATLQLQTTLQTAPGGDWRNGRVADLAFDPSGQYLFVLDNVADTIVQLRTSDWSVVTSLPVEADVGSWAGMVGASFGNRLIMDPLGRYFSVVTDSGLVLVANPNAPALTGTPGADLLEGALFADTLNGLDGDDRLDGGAGADWMSGGAGNDIYVVDVSSDSVTESFGRGIDTVMTELRAYVLPANVENMILTYAGTDTGGRVHGNGLNNIITGSGTHDLLKGLGGDDILIGGAGGIDSFEGAHGNDLMIGGDVSATNLIVNGSFETQDGSNASSDYILASPTEDGGLYFRTAGALWGWQSASGGGFRLDTGGGTNQAFNTGQGKVALDLETAGGNQTIFQDVGGLAAGTSLLLTFTAAYPTTGPASASFEVLWNGVVVATINPAQTAMTQYGVVVVAAAAGTGAAGANRLAFREIGAGADGHGAVLDSVSLNAISFDVVTDTGNANWVLYDSEFDGGPGAVLVNLSDHDAVLGGVLVPAGHGVDTHGTIDTYIGIGSVMVADEGNNWVLGTESYNFLVGGNGNDVLNGAGGDDFLDGNRGDDTLIGGTGDDIFLAHNTGDVVVENPGEGFDEVRSAAATYSIYGTSVENLVSLYNNVAHDFRGNSMDNLLRGGAFNNILRLQDGGDDTALGYGGDDIFLFGAALTAADKVYAGDGRDQIAIQGNYAITLGSDILDLESIAILSGADTRFGDPGTNSYDYDLTTRDVNVAPGVQMIVDASGLRVGEDLRFDGSAENHGSFFIYGGRGVDTLTGGSGNDAFYFGEGLQFGAGDVVNGGPGGIDQLGLRGSYTVAFGANQLIGIENIGLVSAQDTRFGPQGASYNYNLTMNDGNVALGTQLTLDAFALRAGESVSFNGAAESDGTFRIFGGQGHDNIVTGQGNDILVGNRGADNLTGGGGADMFRFNATADSAPGAVDHIHDFAPGIDKIDLVRIDADSHAAGDQAFHWIGSNAFTGSGAASAGELRAYLNNGNWFIEGDTNGDGIADLRITMTEPATPIGQGDFLL